MDPSTSTYEGMYNGLMRIANLHPPMVDYSPIYYEEDIGFEITPTHKLAMSLPTVTVLIPAKRLFSEKKEGIYVKRLKSYLLGMENDTKTYKEMYEGREIAIQLPAGYSAEDAVGSEYSEKDNTIRLNGEKIRLSRMDYDIRYDNTYFEGDLSFTIEESGKLSKDKPTVTYNIFLRKGSEYPIIRTQPQIFA